ncbi:hypothetical protein C7451_10918 [Blastomonas natatoria]|uniref:Uncharacterized protein n=1 Tax=Blastomonas natatoria TaxID=34015 RepID=A0A2V3UWK1_9SPHN|nr:hypothetical protein C7451_10918 [Blastomonas natatoria]
MLLIAIVAAGARSFTYQVFTTFDGPQTKTKSNVLSE